MPTVTPAQENCSGTSSGTSSRKGAKTLFYFETNQGEIRAGFQNKTAKAGDPKSVMLGIGESFRGMKLLSVNLDESLATLDRGGVKVNFSLAKNPVPVLNNNASQTRKFNSGFGRKLPMWKRQKKLS